MAQFSWRNGNVVANRRGLRDNVLVKLVSFLALIGMSLAYSKVKPSIMSSARYDAKGSRFLEAVNGSSLCGELDCPVAGCFLVDSFTCCLEDPEINSNAVCQVSIAFTDNLTEICPFDELCEAGLAPGGTEQNRCFETWERENRGAAAFLYLFLILYIFVAIAIICDDYFIASLVRITHRLQISEDVSGATFMAVGTSAPEFFVSFSDNVLANPPKDIGTGTIVGSAIFNILVIIGTSAFFAPKPLDLNWRPFTRDTIFYLLSVILMVLATRDDEVNYAEALGMIILYCFYVAFMVFNTRIFRNFDTLLEKNFKQDFSQTRAKAAEILQTNANDAEEERKARATEIPEHYLAPLMWPTMPKVEEKTPDQLLNAEEGQASSFNWKGYVLLWISRIYWLLMLPVNVMFRLTVPDCHRDWIGESALGFSLSFSISVGWIGLLAYILVFVAKKFGCMVGADPAVMGLTLLAAGTSVPDCISSIIVARKGKGDMAVANALGSNIFDILIGLGIPWLIATLAFKENVRIDNGELVNSIVFLFGVLALVVVCFLGLKWKIHWKLGVFLCLVYVFYVLFQLLVIPKIQGTA